MRPFQIIFNPTSAAELARMPKELQLHILGEFRGLPQQVLKTELDEFGKLERAGRTLIVSEWGITESYFEQHELGLSCPSHFQPAYPQRFLFPHRIKNGGRRSFATKPQVLGTHRNRPHRNRQIVIRGWKVNSPS